MISITGSAVGFLAWQRKDERDRYSKERSLQHALDNFSAVSVAMAQLEDKVDQGFQDVTIELSQMKTLLSMNQRLIVEAAGMDTSARRVR